jgi:DNA-binding transcriptional regulator YiaG
MTITPALRIRVIRAILGDKPGQFAKRLGVHVNTLARWEDGRNTPDLANEIALGKLCKQINVIDSMTAVFLVSNMDESR